jgi:shikimate 5-dehydrogenase
VSLRPNASLTVEQIPQEIAVDWAAELGPPPFQPSIVSLHQRTEPFRQSIDAINKFTSSFLKLAVEVHDFSELIEGHRWWLEQPTRRAFLPRSKNGRWQWYRQLFGPRMPVHFFREGEGSGPDQPWLWQHVLQPTFDQHFAAVLGNPVSHSRSPMEHNQFFAKYQIPFVAVPVEQSEFAVAFSVLTELGMRFAAVTSPLKQDAFSHAKFVSPGLAALEAANTMWFSKGRWHADNTDASALQQVAKEFGGFKRLALWGGGGVKTSVIRAFGPVAEFSARTGQPLNGKHSEFLPDKLEALIWAVGRGRDFVWPDQNINPEMILDLNYADDSPGLEWAVANGKSYHSGLKMFKIQASLQQKLWAQVLSSKEQGL